MSKNKLAWLLNVDCAYQIVDKLCLAGIGAAIRQKLNPFGHLAFQGHAAGDFHRLQAVVFSKYEPRASEMICGLATHNFDPGQ